MSFGRLYPRPSRFSYTIRHGKYVLGRVFRYELTYHGWKRAERGLAGSRPGCNTDFLNGFIRRHSLSRGNRRTAYGLRVSPITLREGPFDFRFSREGLRDPSRPLRPQESKL